MKKLVLIAAVAAVSLQAQAQTPAQQVVQAELDKFAFVVGADDDLHICVQAGAVKAAMLQARDGAGYANWTKVANVTCSFEAHGDPNGILPPEPQRKQMLLAVAGGTKTADDLVRQANLDSQASGYRAAVSEARFDQERWPDRQKEACSWHAPRGWCDQEKGDHQRKQAKGAEALQWLTANGYEPYDSDKDYKPSP